MREARHKPSTIGYSHGISVCEKDGRFKKGRRKDVKGGGEEMEDAISFLREELKPSKTMYSFRAISRE